MKIKSQFNTTFGIQQFKREIHSTFIKKLWKTQMSKLIVFSRSKNKQTNSELVDG